MEGIVVADIVLCRERDVLDVGERLDFIARHTGLLEPLVIERDVLIAVIHHALETFELERLEFGTAHRLNILLKKQFLHLRAARAANIVSLSHAAVL